MKRFYILVYMVAHTNTRSCLLYFRYCFFIDLLRDFAIWMSIDYTAVPPGDGSLCARYSSPPWQVGVSHVTCVQPPVPARYVSLIAHGSNTVLVLCEVQVFGPRKFCFIVRGLVKLK